MKARFIVLLLLLNCSAFAQQDITVTINGKEFPVKEGQNFGYITQSGETVVFNFKIEEKKQVPVVETQPSRIEPTVVEEISSITKKEHSDKLLQFEYPIDYSVEEKRLSQNVNQITMKNENGGGVIIQEFAAINPENLADEFLFELLDGQAPNSLKKKTIKTANGKKLTGKSVTDFDGTEIQVYSVGEKEQGMLIALIGDDTNNLLTKVVETIIIK